MPLPHDRVMSVQVQIGQSAIHIGSEFPAAGILSPRSIGGTATVLQITTEAAEALWRQALDAGAESFTRSPSSSGVSSTDSSAIRSATAGTSLRSSAMSRRTRSPRQRRRSSASRPPAAGALMAERARILAVTDEGVASFGLFGSPDIQVETHLAGSGARCIAADPADPRRFTSGPWTAAFTSARTPEKRGVKQAPGSATLECCQWPFAVASRSRHLSGVRGHRAEQPGPLRRRWSELAVIAGAARTAQ